jgi:hypothetical protein
MALEGRTHQADGAETAFSILDSTNTTVGAYSATAALSVTTKRSVPKYRPPRACAAQAHEEDLDGTWASPLQLKTGSASWTAAPALSHSKVPAARLEPAPCLGGTVLSIKSGSSMLARVGPVSVMTLASLFSQGDSRFGAPQWMLLRSPAPCDSFEERRTGSAPPPKTSTPDGPQGPWAARLRDVRG